MLAQTGPMPGIYVEKRRHTRKSIFTTKGTKKKEKKCAAGLRVLRVLRGSSFLEKRDWQEKVLPVINHNMVPIWAGTQARPYSQELALM